MKCIKYIGIALLILALTACSVPTEEVTDGISKEIEKEVGKAVEKAKNEAITVGKEKLESTVNDFLGTIKKDEKPTAKPVIQTGGTTQQIPVKVISATDGDTIRVVYDGMQSETNAGAKEGKSGSVALRYLLIDTPETKNKRTGIQPFGPEAAARNKELLESGNVTIEFDIGERVEKYGRLLAYVYVDGKSVNETLVREGLARVGYVYPPNTRHLEALKKAEEQAKKEKLGIWSIENYSTDSGFSN